MNKSKKGDVKREQMYSFIVKLVAPTSGFGIWLTQGFNLAGQVIAWFFGGIIQLFKAL